jgi:hypothetical protein
MWNLLELSFPAIWQFIVFLAVLLKFIAITIFTQIIILFLFADTLVLQAIASLLKLLIGEE